MGDLVNLNKARKQREAIAAEVGSPQLLNQVLRWLADFRAGLINEKTWRGFGDEQLVRVAEVERALRVRNP